MKLKPLKSLEEQGPIVKHPLGKWKPAVPQPLGKQRSAEQKMSAPSNNCIAMACSIWKKKLSKRRRKTANPFWPPMQWHCRCVPKRSMAYWCTPSNYWLGTCLWPPSSPFHPRHPLPQRDWLHWFPIQLLWQHPCPPQGPNGNALCWTKMHLHCNQGMRLGWPLESHLAKNGETRSL